MAEWIENGFINTIGKTKMIEYRKAKIEEAEIVCDIVQKTKAEVYPHYYTQAVVDFFGKLHSIDNIKRNLKEEKIDVFILDGKIVGTGSRTDNHITRVYVLPEYEGKGYGTIIMNHLEDEIFQTYDYCDLDASLPAAMFYEHRGYRTIEHRKHDIGEGKVMVYEIMRKERV